MSDNLWHPNGPLRWGFRIGSVLLVGSAVLGVTDHSAKTPPSLWEQAQAAKTAMATATPAPGYVPDLRGSDSIKVTPYVEDEPTPEPEPTHKAKKPKSSEMPLWEQYWYGVGEYDYFYPSTTDLRADCREYKDDAQWAFDVWYAQGSVGTIKEMKKFYKAKCVGTYAE